MPHQHGRLVAVGDDYQWVFTMDLTPERWGGIARPTMVGIESLGALKVAAVTFELTDSQIEDILHDNTTPLCKRSAKMGHVRGVENPRV